MATLLEPRLHNLITHIHASNHKLVLEFTGAGSLALYWLHSIPGSSRTVLEATDRYAAASLADLLGDTPEQSVARATAIAMAQQAYHRAVRLAEPGTVCLGAGCTAAIATDRIRRGEDRCSIAICDREGVHTYDLVLIKGARDREGEERVVGQLLLHAIGIGCGISATAPLDLLNGEQVIETYTVGSDSVARLLDGEIDWAVIHTDGRIGAQEPFVGAILSGSFNPLHVGHERLADAARVVLDLPVAFELPVVNADKPPLATGEIERRLAQFRWRYPVILSRSPLFVQKATQFPDCVFVLGHDTAARLVAPRYYGGEAGLYAALNEIRAHGCRFLVAGRVAGAAFHTLQDIAIPKGFEDLFIELPESAFRLDLSSTQIRRAMEAEA